MKARTLLSLAAVLSLSVSMFAAAEEAETELAAPLVLPTVEEGDAVILHTNDVHTYIDGDLRYSHVAGLKDYYEAQGIDVVLVDSGDHIQGTAYGSMDKGETIHQLMVAAGYDLATLGNHEFDYGMERALEIANGEIPYVSCNFYHEETGDTVLEPYKIFDLDGVKFAFIGVTTPETFTKSTPAYFQNEAGEYIYGISGGTDGQALYDSVQAAVDAAKEEADVVVALGHLGVDDASSPWTSEEVSANTSDIAMFLDGHSHTEMKSTVPNLGEHDTDLVQTGEYLNAVGMTVLKDEEPYADQYLLTAAHLAEMGIEQDETVKAMEDAWIAEIDEQLGEVIGYASVTLDNYDAEGNRLVRSQATNSGAFAADALMHLFKGMDMDVDVAVMNGGGVRNEAITGELSYKSMKEIHTFGNVACLITVTGQQLLDALEWGARDVGNAECGGFLHASGISYTIDTTIPSTVQQDEMGVWTGGPTGEYRVKDVVFYDNADGEITAEPLDPDATYNLAGYNYTLRDLGDGFAMFDGAVNVIDYVMEDYMVLANFVQTFPVVNGLPTVGEKTDDLTHPSGLFDYGDLNAVGRIQILTEAAAETEVTAQTEIVAETEIAAESEIVAETEIIAESEIVAETEVVAESEVVAETEVVAESEIVAETEILAESEAADSTYTVERGDFLWHIADEQLGDGHLWVSIYEANKDLIKDANKIYAGQVLEIPAA